MKLTSNSYQVMTQFINKNLINLFAYFILLGGISCAVGCESRDTRKEFYSNGKLKSESEFKENIQDGERIDYYESGDLESKSQWRDGKQHGQAIFYYPAGIIKSKSEWKDGKLDGYYEDFYESGELQGFGYYKNGLETGKYKLYYPDGELMQEGSYRDGIRHGEQNVYSKDGKIKTKKHFLNVKGQEVVSSFVAFNEDGTIKEEYKRIKIVADKDTVSVGEYLNVNIQLIGPRFDSTDYILGIKGFDGTFNAVNPDGLDTAKAEGHKVTYQIIPEGLGKQYLRGFADNFKVTEVKGDTTTTIANHFYFEFPFYVKEGK